MPSITYTLSAIFVGLENRQSQSRKIVGRDFGQSFFSRYHCKGTAKQYK